MELKVLSSDEWSVFAEAAHLAVFGEHRPSSMNRIDFALVSEKDGVPMSYTTIREVDSESVYMNYGGSFPSAKGTIYSMKSYIAFIDFLKSKYQNITTLIENTNTPMLKFAMKAGLVVIGVRTFKKSILLEHAFIREDLCGTSQYL